MSDQKLNAVKDRLYRGWILETRDAKKMVAQTNTKIQAQLSTAGVSADGTYLLKRTVQRLSVSIRKDLQRLFSEVDMELQKAVAKAASNATKSQLRWLKTHKVPLVGPSKLAELEAEASRYLKTDFPPGSTLNYKDRLKMIRMRHERALMASLTETYKRGDALDVLSRDVKVRFTTIRPGVRAGVPGGSLAKQISSVMVAEEGRVAQHIERKVLRAHGIELGYFRLSGDHKFSGGSEICEQLSEGIGDGVADYLRGRDDRPTITEGLYLLEEYPPYPHPYCKCHIEPWI